jgi:hypothetical protein
VRCYTSTSHSLIKTHDIRTNRSLSLLILAGGISETLRGIYPEVVEGLR